LIFTIGLGGNVDRPTLEQVANITGALYFHAPTAQELPGIYKIIAAYLGDIAGKDSDIFDAVPMIRDVLPPWIELVSGSFSILPDMNYVNASGYRILEWNLSKIGIGQSWEVTFQVKSNLLGWIRSNDLDTSRVYYEDYDNNLNFVLFPECRLNVLAGPPLPPLLEIEMTNINDVLLKWDKRISPSTEHFLIYRSSNPTQFDFTSPPWVDTSAHNDFGIIPKRTTWNHTGAADSSEQWYYCIRAVNDQGEMSYSSRTVGKWTKTFSQGVSSFSLPLQPIETITPTVDYYLNDMGANYIKWMDTNHEWVQHSGSPLTDAPMEIGRGYEVNFLGSNNKYTFLGMPGAQVKYHARSTVGFDPKTEANSIDATVNGAHITLNWTQPASMIDSNHKYNIYRSETRDGFDDDSAQYMTTLGLGPVSWTDFDVVSRGTEYYYMIVPMNETGVEGASSYSIGIITMNISSQYDTIGIPLQLTKGIPTADYYCDEIAGSVGINFFIEEEQRWSWHSTIMPFGVYDPQLIMIEGYQISTRIQTEYSFVGY
jgi:hypothetical protein